MEAANKVSLEAYGPTKRLIDGQFIVVLVSIAALTAGLLLDKLDGTVYAGMMTALVGAFLGLTAKRSS